jgi:hypothetical protein
MGVTIDIDISDFERAMEKMPEMANREARIALKESAKIVINQARQEFEEHFNGETGKGEQAIQVNPEKTTEDSISIGLNLTIAPYDEYLHEGTKDHMVPKEPEAHWKSQSKPRALHWVKGGQSFFSKGHMVTGIKKFQFLYIAKEKSKEKIVECVNSHVQKALKLAGL